MFLTSLLHKALMHTSIIFFLNSLLMGVVFFLHNEMDDRLRTLVFIAGLFLFGILALSLSAFGARRAVEPVLRITRAMEEVSKGTLDISLDVRSWKEISLLADKFNDMLEKIRQVHEDDKRQLAKYYMLDKLSAVGEIAAGAAHEIRNPLTSIKGFNYLIQGKFDEGDSGWEYAEVIKQEIVQIENIIDQFLLMACPTFPVLKESDLHRIIDETLPEIAADAAVSRVRIETRFCDRMPLMQIDQLQVRQLLKNLCLNAIQAMPGGGQMIIETVVNFEERTVNLIVKDNGIGIPASYIERIGDPFFTTKDKGTGLGLTVCYRIVQNHKGFLQVISSEGMGTACIVRIPILTMEKELSA